MFGYYKAAYLLSADRFHGMIHLLSEVFISYPITVMYSLEHYQRQNRFAVIHLLG